MEHKLLAPPALLSLQVEGLGLDVTTCDLLNNPSDTPKAHVKNFQNYVIFRQHKLLYAAIPKCANSTMKKCLVPLLGVPDPMENYHRKTGLFEYCKKPEVLKRNDYFKVALVRNSWSRVYSCWYEKVYQKLHYGIERRHSKKGIYKGMPFTEFVKAISQISDDEADVHFMGQYDIITHNGSLIMDMMMPMEKIDLLHRVLEGYTQVKLTPLEVRNRGAKEPYTEHYTSETIELVRQRYQKEIDLLGFQFGTNSGAPAENLFSPLLRFLKKGQKKGK